MLKARTAGALSLLEWHYSSTSRCPYRANAVHAAARAMVHATRGWVGLRRGSSGKMLASLASLMKHAPFQLFLALLSAV
jgi:hypothetical protein